MLSRVSQETMMPGRDRVEFPVPLISPVASWPSGSTSSRRCRMTWYSTPEPQVAQGFPAVPHFHGNSFGRVIFLIVQAHVPADPVEPVRELDVAGKKPRVGAALVPVELGAQENHDLVLEGVDEGRGKHRGPRVWALRFQIEKAQDGGAQHQTRVRGVADDRQDDRAGLAGGGKVSVGAVAAGVVVSRAAAWPNAARPMPPGQEEEQDILRWPRMTTSAQRICNGSNGHSSGGSPQ